MKYLPYIFLMILVAIVSFCVFQKPKSVNAVEYEYFRIHINANSNSTQDQELKFKVKANLVDYLTPYLANCDSQSKAKLLIKDNLEIINLIVQRTIKENGFSYDGKTCVNNEYFPTRYYEDYTLEAGNYDALVVTLGEGVGDNWWCVLYPPLCFVNKNAREEQNIIYQSKILNIIKKYFG